MRNTILCLIISIHLSGCTWYNLVAPPRVSINPKKIEAMTEARSYIGLDKDAIINRYGEPDAQRHDILLNGETYDESWSYRYDAGIPILAPDQYALKFYFVDDKVVQVYF